MDFNIFVDYLKSFVEIFSNLLVFLIFVRVVMSWLYMGKGSFSRTGIIGVVYDITNPVMSFFQKFPHRIGMLDLSPIIALFVIDFVSQLILILLNLL